MRIFNMYDDLPQFRGAVVTLGSFDGVHYGHRVLLRRVKARAADTGGESIVVTFSPHPRQVLTRGEGISLLNTAEEKAFLLAEAGVDNLVVLPFTQELASMDSRRFVQDILIGRLGMKHLIVGYDHHFGRDQQGNYASLTAIAPELGFSVEVVEKNTMEGDKVSSSAIRRAISDGDMQRAARLLTRPYMIMGTLSGGVLRANDADKLLPPRGEYNVVVGSVGAPANSMHGLLTVDEAGTMRLDTEGRWGESVIVEFL